jgi:hypothetical protein
MVSVFDLPQTVTVLMVSVFDLPQTVSVLMVSVVDLPQALVTVFQMPQLLVTVYQGQKTPQMLVTVFQEFQVKDVSQYLNREDLVEHHFPVSVVVQVMELVMLGPLAVQLEHLFVCSWASESELA